jgi:anionic cell wall polymer biosynthesis LytR-Cps2A-Psr (LCP) family protein
VYEVGEQHLEGWEALDYARQRYIDGADYARQRHQRQLIRALFGRVVSLDLMSDPVALDRVVQALGDAQVFDGRGYRVVDCAYALRGLRSESITLVGLPGKTVFSDGAYQGEQLDPGAEELFEAVREDQVEELLADHPDLVEEHGEVDTGPSPGRTGGAP